MIATRLGTMIVWGLAFVLIGVLALDLRRDTSLPDRALLPGFDPARVTAVVFAGPRPIKLERDKGGWKWVDPPGEADRQTVEDLLAAVRGGRWHRRADVGAAGIIERTVVLEGDGEITFGIGAELGEQQWVVVGEHAVLVDRWVVRALAPDPVALRVHRPLARVAAATQIEIGSFELAGSPRRITRLAGAPTELLANPLATDQLERMLSEIEVVAIPYGKLPIDTNFRGTRFAFDGTLIAVEMGRCPDGNPAHHAILGPAIGPNCIAESAWANLLAAISTFEVGSEPNARLKRMIELAEPRPIGSTAPIGVVLADGSLLDLQKRPRISDPKQPAAREADPARAAELVAALTTAGKPVALPAAAPIGHLTITTADDPARHPAGHQLQLDLFPGSIVARHGEPIALELDPGAYALLTRPGAAYADPVLWTEDALTIQKLQVGNQLYTRGKVVGEWQRAGAPVTPADKLEALVGQLAAPRSLGAAAKAPATTIKVSLETSPPVGAPVVHVISIGRDGAVCVTDLGHTLDAAICDLVDALK